MSGEVSVVPASLRSAAGSIEDAASGVGSHVPAEVGDVGDAMPGSSSAGVAGQLAGTLRSRFRSWERTAEGHAEALRGTARSWSDADTAASTSHQSLGLRMHGGDLR